METTTSSPFDEDDDTSATLGETVSQSWLMLLLPVSGGVDGDGGDMFGFFLLDGGCDVVEMEVVVGSDYIGGDNVMAAPAVVAQVLRRIWFSFECGGFGGELAATIVVDGWRWW
ncbi:Hypothetical predicted protein [Olea europaea subsp. europaea]|uniref:Uncharacterized protein n=1 Tax=Olea europaea subsp. europaea TaxID=158383 RepID=A0A8S0SNE9_OLEEU|nr:Hypothetical predicted protein [Olea europaea subsp. europaea]